MNAWCVYMFGYSRPQPQSLLVLILFVLRQYLNVTSVETHRFCPDAQAGLRCETRVTHLPLWLLWNHTLCSCTNMKKRGCSVRWATSVFGELPNITAWIRLELIRIREDLIWSPQRFADTPSSQKQLQCIFFSREQLSDERIFFLPFKRSLSLNRLQSKILSFRCPAPYLSNFCLI